MDCLGVMVIIIQYTGASTVAQDITLVLGNNEPFTLANENIEFFDEHNVQSNEGVEQNSLINDKVHNVVADQFMNNNTLPPDNLGINLSEDIPSVDNTNHQDDNFTMQQLHNDEVSSVNYHLS